MHSCAWDILIELYSFLLNPFGNSLIRVGVTLADDEQRVLIDDSTAGIADVKWLWPIACIWFDLRSGYVAGKEAVAHVRVTADTCPGIF